jgi:ABC-type bacteriocin/lantibiotic exporter with double-glycine peptidase domain
LHVAAPIEALAHLSENDPQKGGATMAGLATAAMVLGFDAHGLKIPADNIEATDLPLIVHFTSNHFAILCRKTSSGDYVINDPPNTRVWLKTDFEHAYSGFALKVKSAGVDVADHP